MINDDYIRRIDAKAALSALPTTLDAKTVERCIEAINFVKAANVLRVVHGKDIREERDGHCEFKCSNC